MNKAAALYPLGEELGAGANGTVYATTRNGEQFAVKQFKSVNPAMEDRHVSPGESAKRLKN
jgi:hypothetical protein